MNLSLRTWLTRTLLSLEGSSLTFTTGGVESNGVLIVREDVVELNPECAAAELHRPGEEAQDRVHTAVVTREGIPASRMPDGVLIEQLPKGVDIALRERVEASANEILVGVGHGSFPSGLDGTESL
jgi:hypothetical protein